jgi:hypothetical protein
MPPAWLSGCMALFLFFIIHVIYAKVSGRQQPADSRRVLACNGALARGNVPRRYICADLDPLELRSNKKNLSHHDDYRLSAIKGPLN